MSNRITLSVGSSSQNLYSGSSYNFNGIIITLQKIDYQGYPGGRSSIVFTYNISAESENNNANLDEDNGSTTITKSTGSNTQESFWQKIVNWFKKLFSLS